MLETQYTNCRFPSRSCQRGIKQSEELEVRSWILQSEELEVRSWISQSEELEVRSWIL